MEKDILFIGYPKCSTCQKAEKFLRAHGCDAPMRDIKTENPTVEERAAVKAFLQYEWHALPRACTQGQAACNDGGGAVRGTCLGRNARKASAPHHEGACAHGVPREGVGGAFYVREVYV